MGRQTNMVNEMDRFNVKDGDIWLAGSHVIACGDVERGDGDKLITKAHAHMGYTDPPWNYYRYRQFHKIAGITGKPLRYYNFLDSLVSCLRHVIGDVYIEIGRRSENLLKTQLKHHNAQIMNIWDITYHKTHPCLLYRVTWHPITDDRKLDLTGQDDKRTPCLAIQHSSLREQMVFDPCIGKGLTALTADRLGRKTLGLELSAKRVSVCLTRLERHGKKISKMGRL